MICNNEKTTIMNSPQDHQDQEGDSGSCQLQQRKDHDVEQDHKLIKMKRAMVATICCNNKKTMIMSKTTR